MQEHPKFDQLPETVANGKREYSQPEVAHFRTRGGRGGQYRLVLCGKSGHAGRSEPIVEIERLSTHDALGAEVWLPYKADTSVSREDLLQIAGSLYLTLRATQRGE